jgi:hypothetical protein
MNGKKDEKEMKNFLNKECHNWYEWALKRL